MFDRVNDLSDSLRGGEEREVDLDPDAFAGLLGPDERAKHVLASDGVEHETDGRTTTVEPDGDHAAYLVVSDERVLIVFGDQPEEIEIAFDMDDVSTCDVRSGLLNTTLVVGHDTESVTFSPIAGDVEEVGEYVARVAETYRTVADALETARDRFDALETSVREDDTAESLLLRTRSKLSEARHHATQTEDHLAAKLKERVAETEAQFQRRYVEVWLEQGKASLEDARAALESDDHAAFCASYTTVARAVDELGNPDTFDEVSAEERDRIEALLADADGLGAEYVETTRETRNRATEADDPETAATHWLEAYRRYDAAHEADWDRTADLPTLSTDSELTEIAASAVQALVDHAEALETEGENREDDDAEAARSRYERASEQLREARTIAEKWADVDDDPFETRLATLEEKIDRTKWEWGSPDVVE